jgi:excisionase family DNA binding protein
LTSSDPVGILEQEHHEVNGDSGGEMQKTKELTVQQTALRLGVTLKYVRDLLYEQKLPGAYKKGRVWVIPASTIEARQKTAQGQPEHA